MSGFRGTTVAAYYNEIDPYAAQWLRNLIAAGHIAPGDVDERSILEVKPDDLRGYEQCHFFAGIGGWGYALRLAGWSDDRPVWTGSCPCQPFSAAGQGLGFADERHLWPAWHHLISECRPPALFGEQVASKDAGPWIDLVQDDLEAMGYAFGAVPFPAASVGAPHIRDRLYWVADAAGRRQRGRARLGAPRHGHAQQQPQDSRALGVVAHTDGGYAGAERQQRGGEHGQQPQDGGAGLLGVADDEGLEIERRFPGVSRCASGAGALAAWADIEWIECSDGKARPTQRGIFPLAYGLPGGSVAVGGAISDASLTEEQAAHRFSRVGVLRGAGNAIVPQVAAAFIQACEGTMYAAAA